MIFASSDLPPILLTHGLLVAMLVMYLCVRMETAGQQEAKIQ